MFEILETFIYVILSGLFCPRVWWIRDFEVRLWGSHSMYIYDIPSLVRSLVTKCNEHVKLSQCQSKLVWILFVPEISLWLLCTVFWSRATLLSDIFLDFWLIYAVVGPVSLCVFLTSICYFLIVYYFLTSLCYFLILYYFLTSLCYFLILYYFLTSLCYFWPWLCSN